MTPRGWTPRLTGDAARTARERARAVTDALVHHVPRHMSEASELALFWAYASAAFDDDRTNAAHERAHERLCASLRESTGALRLFGGLAGAGFVAHHTGDAEGTDPLPAIVDARIVEAIDVDRWSGDYDLIGGLVGFGVYFLSRTNVALARRGLELVLRHLAARAEPALGGLGWRTAPELLPPHHRRAYPDGYYNLGLAHGIPGIVALLASLLREGVLPESRSSIEELLRGAVAFVLAHPTGDPERSLYGWGVARPGDRSDSARTAWCYGDLGIALALAHAALALDDESMRDRATVIARACATRSATHCRVRDAALCHGAAGIAHCLARLADALDDDPIVGAGARRWYDAVLASRHAQGFGGYPAWTTQWTDDPGVLSGAAGVALALLAATDEASPSWDRWLLADLTHAGSG